MKKTSRFAFSALLCLTSVTLLAALPAVAGTVSLPVANPGFENGLTDWPYTYTICSVNYAYPDNTVAHTGQSSLKLMMQSCGGGVWQDIPYSLPADTAVQLGFWLLMPNAGSQDNKWFVAAIGLNAAFDLGACPPWRGATDWSETCSNGALLSQATSLPIWTYETLSFVLTNPVSSIDIMLTTENGNGSGPPEPLWVDDVTLTATGPNLGNPVPEPGTLLLLGTGLLGMGRRILRRKQAG